ncbi:hypothetical protein BDV96DRAFT_499253 [Lophiotrema nucula]|uniref:Rhodopsin domain-containing protein n=1 Tax=Lophiotrema nucula TaxID=690887 RepID=A0A6A5YWL4_9PLEO|nr:hypothetical protein BDV96DRAFT_499253 [Lophiotrema nucula]
MKQAAASLEPYHGTLAVAVAFTLTGLSTVIVALRFYCRYYLMSKLSSPDYVMLVALICTWGSAVINLYQIHFLDYTHAWDSRQAYQDIVTGSLLSWWIYRIFYLVDTCLIKTSILLFYNQIASSHKNYHYIVKTMLAIVVLGALGMVIAAILSCVPVTDAWSFEVFWGGFYGKHAKMCYNPVLLWFFSAGFNLVTDTILWIIPPIFLLNLQALGTKRRLELIGIFSIGIVAVVASAIRLYVLALWTSNWAEQGKRNGDLLIWGQVEQHAGIISASIPFLRPLFRKVCCTGARRHPPSPSPAAKLIQPIPPRTPIIPSPSPTLGSHEFKVPPSPLSPISPVQAEMSIGSAV